MKPDSLRRKHLYQLTFAAASLGLLLGTAAPAGAANDTWTGGGQDRFWKTPGNWLGGIAPSAGDALFFGGTRNTATTNNFAADTAFNNLTFNSPAGFFFLGGNEVGLSGNITNNQVVTAQTIGLPLLLNTTPTISVVPNGVLTISGVISGANGAIVTGGGTVNLSGANPFTGGLTVNNSSTVVIGADTNLGAGNLVLNNGTLASTASFALNASRGIAVGPGWGGISVPSGTTLSYGGVMANNGGAGGLTKSGYGTLTLSGANTYTGGTSNTIGTLVLDFGQAGSPATGIINSSSSLELGGGNAGGGVENVAQLIMNGGVAADVQNFNSTFSTFGGSAILATNRTGGTVNLGLGALSHSPGGTIAFVTPAAANGHITTTSPNVNGILGGYALMSGDANAATTFTDAGHTLVLGTNYATVDGSGNIINYSGYSNVTASSTVAAQVAGSVQPNIAINDAAAASVINIATDNAGTVNDINAIRWTTFGSGSDSISIGTGNTLRLGRYGGIIRNGPSTSTAVYIGGPNSTAQSGSGTTGVANVGTLTAGGPTTDTPGEIIVVANNASETSGTTILEAKITDNGTGAVTVVKMGPGSIKLDGNNTFSGGLYLLQGRVQFAGSEIGNNNPDGGGVGPIYVLPGAYLFPSGIGTGSVITNAMFVAGAGDAHEPLGAFRGGTYSGVVTLIGDASFGGNAVFNGPIVGPYNVTFGSAATVNGGATLNNPANNWTGDTILTARSNTGGNMVTCGAANVIPNGFGYGNVRMHGFSTGTVTNNLNGFNQTVNGLSSEGTDTSTFIENATGSATLTVGNNDQSGTFGGVIEDNGGVLALTKIGGGIQTLSGVNTYSGATTVNGGTLALSGAGSIATSASIAVSTGATLDVSGATAFSESSPVQLNGGTLIGNGTVGALGMTNGALTLDIDPSVLNITAASLAVGGSSNMINISSVNGVAGYPAFFTLVQYAGALNGSMNFAIGTTPNASTGGYVSNDVTHSRIVLVLTNGPAVLTWVGNDPTNPTFWDGVTTNWLAFKGTANQTPSAFQTADPVNFDDTGLANSINVIGVMQPGFITFNNSSVNYTFNGTGALIGTAGLIKNGSGSLTLLNTGGDSYKGGVAVNGGTVVFGANNSITGGVGISSGATVQVGVNTGTGSLPGGNVTDAGSLVFNRGANLTVPNSISGAGSITKQDTGVLTLSGNNGTLTGPISAQAGTLQAGSGNALGTGATTISSGAVLDVNGQTLNTTAVVTVSGSGIGNQGAIINSGAASQNALNNVTLAGNTTFGGTNRWDIRGTAAQLATSPAASPYTLTKVGPNFIGLVGANVDSALGNIDIQAGTLDYEGATTGLGDPNSTLTVEAGATFEMYNAASALSKIVVLNGTGTNDTLLCGNGTPSSISGTVTLNGTVISDAAANTMLTFGGNVTGAGSLVKIGTGTNLIGGGVTASYTGSTTVSNGTLIVNGTLASATTVATNATLAGNGTVSGVSVLGGTVSPGDSIGAPQATLTVGNLTLSNATVALDLTTTPVSGNDLLAAGNLTVNGTNTLQITPLSFMNVGDTYTLVTYTGAALPSGATNQLRVTSVNGLFSFSLVDPSTTPGAIQIKVVTAEGNDLWTGATSSTWDNTTTNWTRNGTPANFNDGDVVTFDDSSAVNTVNISGTRTNSGIIEAAGSRSYTFAGTGSLTGPGGLDFEGSQLTIANSGTNTFTGIIYINFGNLFVGNGGAAGNLGSGTITNNGAIAFNRSDSNLVVANAIRGTGSITNMGTGMVTLSGASAFTGPTTILRGAVRVLNSAALGTVASSVVVSNGATLDITNNANLGAKSITASGAGVGGNGAIVNSGGNGGFVAANFAQLTITTNIVIGGSGRLDFRASSATAQDASLNTTGGGPSLIKLGTNQLQMAGVQIDSTFGDILVGGGTLGFQWQIPSLGDPARTLSVSNGASIAFFDTSNAVSKVLLMNDGSTLLGQHGTTNEFDGPVTLNGTDTFNISSGTVMLFANEFSGSGSLVKTGPGTLALSLLQTNGGSEIFSGNTVVGQGTLLLADTADLTNSPMIILSNATLNVSARTDGTLTLGAARPQTLAGGGVINGALVENANSTVNPGNGVAPAVLTVSNAATLNGSVIMNLKRGAGVTNDQIAAASITASGSLTVTNLGADLVTGDKFKLFSAAVAGFAPINLPAANTSGTKTYQWRNDVAVDGSITLTNVLVSGGPTTNANITSVTLSGANLLIHGTNNNVPNTSGHYVILTSTNVASPLINWTPVFTNTFNTNGTFDYTNPVVPGTPQQYIDVQVTQ